MRIDSTTEENETPLYPLDQNEITVSMSKGRFTHVLRKPSNEMILEREKEFELEVPVTKNGDYKIPESKQEEVDAKYYEQIKVSADGYGERDVPTLHKATAFQGLFQRTIYIDENCDIFGDEITVIEEVGSGDEPDFVVKHILRQPDEKQLKKMQKIFKNGEMVSDKRGRRSFATKSNLPSAMQSYAAGIMRIEGASVGGESYTAERRDEFLANVNPLVQRAVIQVLVAELTENLLD